MPKCRNAELPKKAIVEHFKLEGVHKDTVYKYLKCYENNKPLNSGIRRGRPVKKATKPMIRKITKMFDHRDGRSQRKAARRLGISQSYLNTILNTKTDVRYYEKTTVPHRTPIQVANAKT